MVVSRPDDRWHHRNDKRLRERYDNSKLQLESLMTKRMLIMLAGAGLLFGGIFGYKAFV